MDIKEELDKYNDYKSDIKSIDSYIAKLKFEDVTISGSNFEVNGYIKSKGKNNSREEKLIINNTDKIMELEAQKKKIQAHIDYLDSLINTLDKLEIDVIELKYKKNYNFTEISKIIYRSRSNVYDIHDRAIQKMDKKLKKRQK